MTQFFSDNSLSRKNLHLNKPEFVTENYLLSSSPVFRSRRQLLTPVFCEACPAANRKLDSGPENRNTVMNIGINEEESSRKTVLRRQRQQFPPVGKNMKFLRIMFGL